MYRKQSGFAVFELFIVFMVIFGGFGYVWNIVKIAESSFAVIEPMLILRFISIVMWPLGCILGYL